MFQLKDLFLLAAFAIAVGTRIASDADNDNDKKLPPLRCTSGWQKVEGCN